MPAPRKFCKRKHSLGKKQVPERREFGRTCTYTFICSDAVLSGEGKLLLELGAAAVFNSRDPIEFEQGVNKAIELVGMECSPLRTSG